MAYCDVCGAPVHEEDYYEEYDMYICPDKTRKEHCYE